MRIKTREELSNLTASTLANEVLCTLKASRACEDPDKLSFYAIYLDRELRPRFERGITKLMPGVESRKVYEGIRLELLEEVKRIKSLTA